MICRSISEIIQYNLDLILSLRSDFEKKMDNSYVSKGDLLVQDLIVNFLNENHQEFSLISEEMDLKDNWDYSGSYIIIDPIDGTENFVSGLKEWGVGISVYRRGKHIESAILLPELHEFLYSGDECDFYTSRIMGLSSSLSKADLMSIEEGFEYRIIGCAMYNLWSVVRGSYRSFYNPKGVNCWDILPGINLALEHNCEVWVDEVRYRGEILFPIKKYKIKVINQNGK
jgi:myo-inositol-1(or 4)-monophosphatase